MKKLIISVGSTEEKRVFKSFEIVKSSSLVGNSSTVYILFEGNSDPCVYPSLELLFDVLSKSIEL